MITDYATDTDHWEDWQHAYRYGVLLIYPPDPLRSTVNHLRSRHDPRSQRYCDAHISLTVPAPAPVTPAQWAGLEAVAAGIAPFEIAYGPLRDYLPHPGVCLAIAPHDALDALRVALESVPPFSDAPPRRYPFSPHMTIAEFITAAQTVSLMEALAGEVPSGRFLCRSVAYAVPDASFHFAEGRRLLLGPRRPAA